jgi:STE24 endopeptidase
LELTRITPVNEPKSSRYHRLARRAGFVSVALSAGLLLLLASFQPRLSVIAYAVVLTALHALITFPVSYYRGFFLEQRYELSSEPFAVWFRDHLKGFALALVLAVVAAWSVYRLMAMSPRWWWIFAALAGSLLTLLLARLAPVLLLPLFYTFRPLERPELQARLMALSERAGVPVLGVFEWRVGDRTRRANAALVGSGKTRRILVSDTLLAEYSDDEIEVILAHELAHHVHRDIGKGILLEFVLLLTSGFVAATVLNAAWPRLGLTGPADPAGFPVLVLAAGAVMLAATPLVLAFSRSNERRADAFAIELTKRNDAFVSAMRRLGAQNLEEEQPSAASIWLFYSHPPIEERIAAARPLR